MSAIKFRDLVLVLLVLLPSISGFAAPKVYDLDISYEPHKITLISKELSYSRLPDTIHMPEDGYQLELKDRLGRTLYSYKFKFPSAAVVVKPADKDILPLTGSGVNPYEIEMIELETVSKNIIVPYHSNAKVINIFDPDNQLVLSTDVSQYSSDCEYRMCSLVEIQDNLPERSDKVAAIIVTISIFLIIVLGGLLTLHRKKHLRHVYSQIQQRR